MAKQVNVGDRVELNKAGLRQFGNQSNGSVGLVTEPADGEGWYWVKWEAGNGNNYKAEHLKLAGKVEENLLAEIIYKDSCGDFIEVDTEMAGDVYFRSGKMTGAVPEFDRTVILSPKQVKKVRKQLKAWLDKHHSKA